MSNAFGLGVVLLWQWLAVLNSPLLAPMPDSLFEEPGMGYAFFSLVLCGTFFALSRQGSRIPAKWHRIGMWGAGGLMALAWLPCGQWLRDIPAAGPFLFLALPAVGSATQLAAWEWRLCGSPFIRQAFAFGSACLVRTAGIVLATRLFPATLPIVAVLLPFLGAFLWTPPDGDMDCCRLQPNPTLHHLAFPPRLALRAATFFFISAMFISILLDRRSPGMSLAQTLTDPLYTLGALGVGLFLLRFPSLELRKIYIGAETFLTLGFVAFAALGEGRPTWPLALLQFGAGIFGAYFFTLLLYLGARAGKEKALSVVTTGQTVITGSVLLGMLLAKAINSLAFRQGVPFVLTTSLLGVTLLFFSGYFFRDDRESFAGFDLFGETEEKPEEAMPAEAEETADTLHLNLVKKELSRQEIRVALLVAQGLSNDDMVRELNITGNTIRTHLKNIHRKLGSANRKELQDMLQRMGQ